MSDTARQGLTGKAAAAFKPDSEKTNSEHFGDKVKGKADSAASTAQPEVRSSVHALPYSYIYANCFLTE